VYHRAIKGRQPDGPYAIAGYSYGSMLAFETAKVLERNGDEVRFLGVFNLPPHIKFRMRQLDWRECLLNLAYFLDLITEQRAQELSHEMRSQGLSGGEALDYIMQIADPVRLAELSLTADAISNWAGLAYAMQRMAVEYEPQNKVHGMDVFYCTPLAAITNSRQKWLEQYIKPWGEFCKTQPRFHEVDGSHYTMIGPNHVLTFQKKLKHVLLERNI
jgi:thioesterase domain-containing protein